MAFENPFLEAAFRIGARLTREAIWHAGRCNWLGWSREGTRHRGRRVYRSFGTDLYGGTSGIALFLARLYRHTGERPLASAAIGGFQQALSKLDEVPLELRTSFYTGDLGIAWALVEGGESLDRPEWVEHGLDLAGAPEEEHLPLGALDFIRGSAGAIGPLLDLHRRYGSRAGRQRLLALARRHGQHLLDHARRRPGGLGWPQEPAGLSGETGETEESQETWETKEAPELTGLAHGAAGMSLALLELAHGLAEAGEDRPLREACLAAAREGLGYERALFQPEEGAGGNWPDLRFEGPEPHFMIAWCHGAAGIGLARLRALDLEMGNDGARDALEREVKAALRTVVGHLARPTPPGGLPGDFSLCHGASGLAELLLESYRRWHRPALASAVEEVAHFGIETFLKPGLSLPCGVGREPGLADSGETPGLLLGLAGIGHFYLRLAEESVPSILLPPTAENPGRGAPAGDDPTPVSDPGSTRNAADGPRGDAPR
jgi:lantibiotic modifying enzyme